MAENASASFGDERLASKHSSFGVVGLALPNDEGGDTTSVCGELVIDGGPEKAKENAEASELVGEGVSCLLCSVKARPAVNLCRNAACMGVPLAAKPAALAVCIAYGCVGTKGIPMLGAYACASGQ